MTAPMTPADAARQAANDTIRQMTVHCPDCTAMSSCTERCARDVECAVCGRRKHLIGRSMGDESWHLCDDYCPGYRQDPRPPHLWSDEWADHAAGHPREATP